MRTTGHGNSRRQISRRAGLAAVIAVLGALSITVAIAAPAAAHVRVTSDDARAGGYAVLTFRVPTESASASTTGLTVTFPAKTPIASVSTQPLPGWTAKVTTKKLAEPVKTDDGEITTYVSQVDWTARDAASAIKPGEFQLFNVSVGPLPDASSLSFPSLQHYSDGKDVNWNQTSTGGVEPEHPAPVLDLDASSETGAAPSSSPSASQASGSSDSSNVPRTAGSDSDSNPAWPGIVGLVAGVLGLLVAGVALARTNRKPTGSK